MMRRRWRWLALIILNALAVGIRCVWARFASTDMITYLIPWYDYIVQHGGWRALGDPFSHYSPAYMYLLTLATYLRPFLPQVLAIKAISIAFDFAAAVVMYRLVRLKYQKGHLPWLAYYAVLFAPTVFVNSSIWGQCDAIYSTWLLASVYFACRGRPVMSLASFAVSLSFKGQAVFLGPFILGLLLRKHIPWRYVLVVPGVYVLMMLPALLLGRSFWELATLYAYQGSGFHSLTRNAANLYLLVPDSLYDTATVVGLAVAASVGVAVAAATWRSRAPLDSALLVHGATLSVALMPFLLPKMHDRYFFPADLISIALAFYCAGSRRIPFLFQLTSLVAYQAFLTGRQVVPLALAAAVNAVLVGYLLLGYLRALCASPPEGTPAGATGAPTGQGAA